MNPLKMNLVGMIVVLSNRYYKSDVIDRVFNCKYGPGCFSPTKGTVINGFFLSDGCMRTVESNEIERLATGEEMRIAKARTKKGTRNTVDVGVVQGKTDMGKR